MKIKNVSPLGDLWIPSLNIEIKAGSSVDVDDEAGAALLLQSDNFVPADKAAVAAVKE